MISSLLDPWDYRLYVMTHFFWDYLFCRLELWTALILFLITRSNLWARVTLIYIWEYLMSYWCAFMIEFTRGDSGPIGTWEWLHYYCHVYHALAFLGGTLIGMFLFRFWPRVGFARTSLRAEETAQNRIPDVIVIRMKETPIVGLPSASN
jgi:hypothetical protein